MEIDVYANDTTLYANDKSLTVILERLQNVLCLCQMIKMSLNPKRSSCGILGLPFRTKSKPSMNLVVEGLSVTNSSILDIGTIYLITSNLCFCLKKPCNCLNVFIIFFA